MRWPLLVLLTLLAAPAVARTQQPEEKPRIRRSPDLITAAEITERSDIQTAYDAVQRLRSAWLRSRDVGNVSRSPAPIVVYIDGMRAGGLEALAALQASRVVEMRRLNASDATTRYGTDHTSGAIVVTTVRRTGD
jgi:hypothetical protein